MVIYQWSTDINRNSQPLNWYLQQTNTCRCFSLPSTKKGVSASSENAFCRMVVASSWVFSLTFTSCVTASSPISTATLSAPIQTRSRWQERKCRPLLSFWTKVLPWGHRRIRLQGLSFCPTTGIFADGRTTQTRKKYHQCGNINMFDKSAPCFARDARHFRLAYDYAWATSTHLHCFLESLYQ